LQPGAADSTPNHEDVHPIIVNGKQVGAPSHDP
jgi:hypothetical protein